MKKLKDFLLQFPFKISYFPKRFYDNIITHPFIRYLPITEIGQQLAVLLCHIIDIYFSFVFLCQNLKFSE